MNPHNPFRPADFKPAAQSDNLLIINGLICNSLPTVQLHVKIFGFFDLEIYLGTVLGCITEYIQSPASPSCFP